MKKKTPNPIEVTADWETISKKLGRFVIDFEDVNWSMLANIRSILSKNGLENDAIHEILLSELTAEPIRRMLQSLCGEFFKPDKEEMKILSYIFNQIQELTERRNHIVHSVWTEVNIGDQPITLTTKLKRDKNGAATKRIQAPSDSLIESDIERARHCSLLLGGIARCILLNSKLKDTFEKTVTGYKACPIPRLSHVEIATMLQQP